MYANLDERFNTWIFRLKSLRARLLILLFLTFLPVYSFILYAVLDTRQQAAENARGDSLSLTRLVALKQQNFIEFSQQQLLNFALLPIVRRPELAAQCKQAFSGMLKLNPFYNNIGVINLDGTLRCSAIPMTNLPNLSDRRYFKDAISTRSFVIGDYQIGRVTGKGGTNLAYPVMDATGKPQAVVFIALDLAALTNKLIEATSLPPGSTISIWDNHGTILARYPDPALWVGTTPLNSPSFRILLGQDKEGSTEETGIDGVKRLYVFKPFYSSGTKQVYVSAGIPTEAVYAGANALLTRSLLLMALVSAAVIALALAGSSMLVLRPMSALMDAARRLGSGNLSVRTGLPHSSDEFGQMARVFDEMAQSIEERDKLLTMVGVMAKVGGWEFDARTLKGTWTEEVARIHETDPNDPTSVETGIKFYREESRKRIESAIKVTIEQGTPYDLELEMTTAKGKHKWVRTIGQAVSEDGVVVKVRGSFQDITDQKYAEEEIRQLNTSLEQRILERTSELTSANTELEAFSYSVSHDLRAPLRAIDGYSQALLEDYSERLDDQGKDFLNRVRNATQRMGDLIDDMLTLSRVTRAEMRRETIDLSALAAEVFAELQKSEPERKVSVRIDPALVAEGDSQLLRVVLTNLLGNAWKFTGKTANAEIEFGAMHNPEGTTEFSVRDNGVGFDMAYAGKLFAPFQRMHLSSEFPGTGVGLATVQRIVRRHGGQIRAVAMPGHGATLSFSLAG